MFKCREKYEQLIKSSPLFSLDREREAVLYKREAYKMIEYLYGYMMSANESKYIDFGLEITETARRCIQTFDIQKGDFLSYFNAAMLKEYRRASSKKLVQDIRAGIHVSENDDLNIRKICKLMECRGVTEPSEEQIVYIAGALNLPNDVVREAISINQKAITISDIVENDEGEETSLFDLLVDGDTIGDRFIEEESAIEFLQHINAVFVKRQARQKPLLSKLLTSKIASSFAGEKQLWERVKKLDFWDEEILKLPTMPSAKDIADDLGLSESSVSRTYKNFIALL